MTSINLNEKERKDLITQMKREAKPSHRLRMHIVLLVSDKLNPAEIAAVLYCSRTTVYAVAKHFSQRKEKAFDDQTPRGPAPALDVSVYQRLGILVEQETPRQYGFNRSRWTCAVLTAQLLKERGVKVCTETVRRALHRLKLRWRRPRPVPPDKNKEKKMQRLLEILRLLMTLPENEVAMFHDETETHLNPKIGFAWMRQGHQKLLPTPGKNQKAVLSGGVNWRSGRLLVVRGAKRVTGVFVEFLEHARTRLRCYRKIHVIADQDSSHTSSGTQEYLERWEHRIQVHLLPSWSPDANPMEGVWLVLHNTITRNHGEDNLEELLSHSEQFLQDKEPFPLKLPKVYAPLLELLKEEGVQLSCEPI